MTELDHILDQIDRSFRGDAWHGPSVWEVLADIDAAKAGRVGEVDDATGQRPLHRPTSLTGKRRSTNRPRGIRSY